MSDNSPMNIFERWDVRPVINACGSVTRLGGAPMVPEVIEAMNSAAGEAVSLEQLQAAACSNHRQIHRGRSRLSNQRFSGSPDPGNGSDSGPLEFAYYGVAPAPIDSLSIPHLS